MVDAGVRFRPETANRGLIGWIGSKAIPAFDSRILPVGAAVALCCAALRLPDPQPHRDSLTAAIALAHRLTMVTRDRREFEPIGVRLPNPWRSA
ncbi:hypothetical protein IGS68_09720 [Skermanella sp. TT6]|uniref:PIN domain-containing protein n=1 Tax=Skermanella cutis TaxID=2775420 RepID=A0ABX7BAQ0_9PROT|nr:hypothetical protein [Skermanella sp. TT6]QQP91453.1 hypothetical protein IGS68_09720 [Skermanella sp. TT6]